ncbi:MAG: hypothetical protein EHM43_10495, partial [Ignavibacteriae bacterium]
MRYFCVLVVSVLSVMSVAYQSSIAQINGTQGKEFWITIPPNELLPFPTNELEIYVSSLFDTEIEVFDAAAGHV